ncbi:MAG TPA: Fe-Mn family superoxide dismutase [Anaeromyxobacteraceae bacterium]
MAELAKKYTPKSFPHLKGLKGISDGVLESHFKLYEGYVNRTNKLTETLFGLAKEKQAAGSNPAYAEMSRRMGFEYNGMVLHEYYFSNLKSGAGDAGPGGKLKAALEASFTSYDIWLADFKAIATMPGVGWAITYQNPENGWLSNHWVTLHEEGNPAGFKPVLVMDAWEHAFVPDYKANERAKYVDAYFSNIDWATVESRLK